MVKTDSGGRIRQMTSQKYLVVMSLKCGDAGVAQDVLSDPQFFCGRCGVSFQGPTAVAAVSSERAVAELVLSNQKLQSFQHLSYGRRRSQ